MANMFFPTCKYSVSSCKLLYNEMQEPMKKVLIFFMVGSVLVNVVELYFLVTYN